MQVLVDLALFQSILYVYISIKHINYMYIYVLKHICIRGVGHFAQNDPFKCIQTNLHAFPAAFHLCVRSVYRAKTFFCVCVHVCVCAYLLKNNLQFVPALLTRSHHMLMVEETTGVNLANLLFVHFKNNHLVFFFF